MDRSSWTRARKKLRVLQGEVFDGERRRALRAAVERLRRTDGPDVGPALLALHRAWGNRFSADVGYLSEAFAEARSATLGVLECGSGLSTLVCAVAAEGSTVPVVSLEHDRFWAAVTRLRLRRAGLAAEVRRAPLRSFGAVDWYAPPADVRARRFDVVICDGPPGQVRGNRSGLVPVMGDAIAGAVVLLDDADRPGEQGTLDSWQRSGAQVVRRAPPGETAFARVRLPGAAARVAPSPSQVED